MASDSSTPRGVTLNVMASLFFALMFAYTALLPTLGGAALYGWRIALTFPCLTFFILLRGYAPQLLGGYRRLRAEPYFWITRLLSSGLLGIQLWLFMWAPGNGYGLEVSLGYFMMPIVMVVVGRIAFHDVLSPYQQLACALAVTGVVSQLVISQTFAWPTLVVGLGYPFYFWLRRYTDTNNIVGLWFDMLISLPLGVYLIVQSGALTGGHLSVPHTLGLVAGLGLLSALALVCQALSAPLLNLSLFGLLVYVEPVLLMLVALLLGETITLSEWPTYVAIWLAVALLALEGALGLRQRRALAKPLSD